MGIGWQPIPIHLLPKLVSLLFGQVTFQKRSGIDAWRTVSLDIDQVSLLFCGRSTEEIVKTNIVEGCAGLKTWNMVTQGCILEVRPHDHRHRIPPNQRTKATLKEQVTWHSSFFGNRDGISIGSINGVWQLRARLGDFNGKLLQNKLRPLGSADF